MAYLNRLRKFLKGPPFVLELSLIHIFGFDVFTEINTDEKTSESLGTVGSLGVGYRILSKHEHAYVGVNAFVDRAFTGNYNRISGGVEYVNGLNEVYANVYRGCLLYTSRCV